MSLKQVQRPLSKLDKQVPHTFMSPSIVSTDTSHAAHNFYLLDEFLEENSSDLSPRWFSFVF